MRADLFYRLNVMPVTVPPLASRGEDILLLAEHFARARAKDGGCPRISFSDEVRARFSAYPWPGNVRELKNLVEPLTILYPGQAIGAAQMPPEFHASADKPAYGSIDERLAETERDVLLRALDEAGGCKGKAAAALGISRHALKRRLQRLKIE